MNAATFCPVHAPVARARGNRMMPTPLLREMDLLDDLVAVPGMPDNCQERFDLPVPLPTRDVLIQCNPRATLPCCSTRQQEEAVALSVAESGSERTPDRAHPLKRAPEQVCQRPTHAMRARDAR